MHHARILNKNLPTHAGASSPFLQGITDYTDDSIDEHYIGAMEETCNLCGAQMFRAEMVAPSSENAHFNLCCHNGKAKDVPQVPPPPEPLFSLLTDNDSRSRAFKTNIRAYNAALAFVSFGASHETFRGGGPPVFTIHGSVYHAASTLAPPSATTPKYAQLYLYDHNYALDVRAQSNPALDRTVLEDLQELLETLPNPYVTDFQHMHEIASVFEKLHGHEITLGFKAKTSEDVRRYNHPSVREVAAVFIGSDGAPPDNRDIRVWPRDESVYNIPEQNEHVDPLTYVLLFPEGLAGWHEKLKHCRTHSTAKYTRLTTLQFYSHRLMIFDKENPLPHAAGLLFQQYLVDAYCRAEAQRLAYIRMHQDDLRAEAYSTLQSATQEDSFQDGVTKIGRQVILPSSYPGSPRAMQQNYLDAMAIVRRYGIHKQNNTP